MKSPLLKRLLNFYDRQAFTVDLSDLAPFYDSEIDSRIAISDFTTRKYTSLYPFSLRFLSPNSPLASTDFRFTKYFKKMRFLKSPAAAASSFRTLYRRNSYTRSALLPYPEFATPALFFYRFFDLRSTLLHKHLNFSFLRSLSPYWFFIFKLAYNLFIFGFIFYSFCAFLPVVFMTVNFGHLNFFFTQSLFNFFSFYALYVDLFYLSPFLSLLTPFQLTLSLTPLWIDLTNWLQIFLRVWEDHFQTWEFFYLIDFFSLTWLIFLLVIFHLLALLAILRVALTAFLLRFDPWTLFLRLFLGLDYTRNMPSVDELTQAFSHDRTVRMMTSNFLTNSQNTNPRIATLLYDYNLASGFGGFVGFIDFFPSYSSSIFNFKAFDKNRSGANPFLRFFLRYYRRLKVKRTLGRLRHNEFFWRDAALRVNYFPTIKSQFLATSRFFTSPRFKLPFFKNVFVQFALLFLSVISHFGDLEVIRLRERFFFYLSEGRKEWLDEEFAPIVSDPTVTSTLNSSIDWYHRELSAIILNQTVSQNISKKTRKLFKFGWQNIINDYSFWSFPLNFDGTWFHQGEAEELDLVEREDEYSGPIDFTLMPDKHQYDSFEGMDDLEFDGESVEDRQEEQDEPDAKEEAFFFEDGFLHTDLPSINFEEEEDFLDIADEGVAPLGHGNEDDDEALDFVSNPMLGYGAGQEEEYLLTTDPANLAWAAPEFDDAAIFNNNSIFSTFYQDVSDFLFVNSAHPGYNNFLEYPSGRFLNPMFSGTSRLNRNELLGRSVTLGRFLFFFAPFVSSLLLLPYNRLWAALFASWFISFFMWNFLFLFALGLTLYPFDFATLPVNVVLSLLFLLILFFSLVLIFTYLYLPGFTTQLFMKACALKIPSFTITTLFILSYFAVWPNNTSSPFLQSNSTSINSQPLTTFLGIDSYTLNSSSARRFFFDRFSLDFHRFSHFSSDMSALPYRSVGLSSASATTSIFCSNVFSLPQHLNHLNCVTHSLIFFQSSRFFEAKSFFTCAVLSEPATSLAADFTSLYSLHGTLDFVFLDVRRLQRKASLLNYKIPFNKNSFLKTTKSTIGLAKALLPETRQFSGAALFYSVSDRYPFALTSTSSQILNINRDLPLSPFDERLLPSITHSTNALSYNQQLKGFKFFSINIFGEHSFTSSSTYANLLRLLFSDNYASSIFNDRTLYSSKPYLTLPPEELFWKRKLTEPEFNNLHSVKTTKKQIIN